LSTKIRHAKLVGVNQDRAKLGIISDDRRYWSVVLEYQGQQLTSTCEAIGSIDVRVDDLVVSRSSVACVYSRMESALFVFPDDGSIERLPLFSRTSLFASCGRSVLFCPDPYSVARLALKHGVPATAYICHSQREITALTASRLHQILAVATVDGTVAVHDAKNGTVLTRYETGQEIRHLLITDGWGFVVALSATAAFVFSVNGDFIRSDPLTVPFAKVFAHTSFGRFDFVSFVTHSNEIGIFEALFPQNHGTLTKFPVEIANIIYDSRHRILILCGVNGAIRTFPYAPPMVEGNPR
jgi:hypothetical protein